MSSLTPRLDKLDRNYIINGNFDYWQRNTTANITGAVLAVDRFFTNYNSGAAGTVSRSTDVPDADSLYSAQVDVTTGLNATIGQRIESVFSKDLAGKTITIKFKVKAVDATGREIRILMATPNVTDNWAASTGFTDFVAIASPTTGVWTTYSTTVSIPADAVRGLQLIIRRGGASATTSTRYSKIQILLGEVSDSDFSYAGRDVVQELDLCRRYYEKSFAINTIPANGGSATTLADDTNAVGYLAGNTLLTPTIPFKITKRASPTVTVFGNSSGRAIYSALNNAAIAGSVTVSTGPVGTSGVNGLNVNQQDTAAFVTVRFHYAADAEL